MSITKDEYLAKLQWFKRAIERFPSATHTDMARELPFRDQNQTLHQRVDYNIKEIENGREFDIDCSFESLERSIRLLENNLLQEAFSKYKGEKKFLFFKKYSESEARKLAEQEVEQLKQI